MLATHMNARSQSQSPPRSRWRRCSPAARRATTRTANAIYGWQFGQDVQRDVDYSNPRLPILPKCGRRTELWPVPSPYQFNDLSRYSLLTTGASGREPIARRR